MFCQYCGTALTASGSACPKCGGVATGQPAPVAGPANVFAPPPGGNWAASPVPPRQGTYFPWILIAAVGCLGLVFVIAIVAAITVPAFTAGLTSARRAAHAADCRNNMKQVGVYLNLYESKFRSYPDELRDLCRPDLATNANIFICPVNGQPYTPSAPAGLKWEDFSSRVAIQYLKPPAVTPMSEGPRDLNSLLVAWETTPHPDGRRCVLYLTGRVDLLDDAMFQALLKSRREWK